MLQFVYTKSCLIKKDGHQTCYHINIQCNKVKVIVILFSCSSDFALYLEDFFMILGILVLCDITIDIVTNVGRLDPYFMVQ